MSELSYISGTDSRLIGRRSPYFEPTSSADIHKWKSLGFRLLDKGASMVASERAFLEALDSLSAGTPSGEVIDGEQIQDAMSAASDASITKAWQAQKITNLCKSLFDAGVATRVKVRNGARGGGWLYSLRSPETVAELWREQAPSAERIPGVTPGKARTPPTKKALTRASELYEVLVASNLLSSKYDLNTQEPWTYLLVSQLIEKCSRYKASDPRTSISTPVSLNNEVVEAEAATTLWDATSEPSFGLITADDSQLLLALLTAAMQQIIRDVKQGKRPENLMKVDLRVLAKQLSKGKNETYAYKGFQRGMVRIINTSFALTVNPEGRMAQRIQAHLGIRGNRTEFRLVDNVTLGADNESASTAASAWKPQRDIRYVTFSLSPMIWSDLMHGNGWMVHPSLLYERSGFTHRVYNHLKAHSSLNESYSVTGDTLMRMLNMGTGGGSVNRRAGRFCDQLWRLFHDHATQSTGLLTLDNETPYMEMSLQFFDLELEITPLSEHKSALLVEARHSEASRQLLLKQDMRIRETLEQLQAISGQGTPRIGKD
ncbi:hypothetical protein [Vreelandella rituensis]|nr:hypothetical protein [Halomonas rituensis]